MTLFSVGYINLWVEIEFNVARARRWSGGDARDRPPARATAITKDAISLVDKQSTATKKIVTQHVYKSRIGIALIL